MTPTEAEQLYHSDHDSWQKWAYQKASTRLRFGFRSKNQKPLFMIWREYLRGKDVTFAQVIFKIG